MKVLDSVRFSGAVAASVVVALGGLGCPRQRAVPHFGRYGIYALTLATDAVELLFGTDDRISDLHLNWAGDRFVFAREPAVDGIEADEIWTVIADGSNPTRLTDNLFLDTYPCWSPDGSQVAFLSWRDSTLDIFVMNADGTDQRLLYDSGRHDGDVDWVGDEMVFTQGSCIWRMRSDGTQAEQVTNPPRAGEWGNAVLPFGDYDPRLSPDGTRIVFERMVGDSSSHGNYEIFLANADGSDVQQLTGTGYTQGMCCWTRDSERVAFIISAIGNAGSYRLHLMNRDGSDEHGLTPGYFPSGFLCNYPAFSPQGAVLYFIGEWWE